MKILNTVDKIWMPLVVTVQVATVPVATVPVATAPAVTVQAVTAVTAVTAATGIGTSGPLYTCHFYRN